MIHIAPAPIRRIIADLSSGAKVLTPMVSIFATPTARIEFLCATAQSSRRRINSHPIPGWQPLPAKPKR
jgi:hypothetical protein